MLGLAQIKEVVAGLEQPALEHLASIGSRPKIDILNLCVGFWILGCTNWSYDLGDL